MKLPITKYIKHLTKYLKNSKWLILAMTFVMGGSILIQLINPQIVSYFIDGVGEKKPTNELVVAAVIFILAAFGQQLLAITSTYLSQNIGWKATNKLRLDLVRHCLSFDMSYFKEHQSGEIVERIDGDVTALFNFFSRLLVSLLNNVLLTVGIVLLLTRENITIGLSVTLFLAASVTVIFKTQSKAVDNFKSNREMTAKFYGFLGEHISSTEDIRANGAILIKEGERYKEWIERFEDLNPKVIYSMWEGYLDPKMKAYNGDLAEFLKPFAPNQLCKLHTSGHATRKFIEEVIAAINPWKAIIPIHTENKARFDDLNISEELKQRIIYLNDGEEYVAK